jgi:hypothetical protein
MPHNLPKWQTACGYYWQWRNTGLWEQINAILAQKVLVDLEEIVESLAKGLNKSCVQ